ncbi:MAG: holo-ACP synthase [Planctomycetota bacterium]|jgi:holo-[acyl-carrier protein] synthase
MSIVGLGVDLVDVDRIERMLAEHGERFVDRCFTPAERAYAEAGDRRRPERYAARFACKEAALKALGTGWRSGIAWTDVGVVTEPSGRPRLVVTGEAARIAAGLGIVAWHVSLSHTDRAATATVIACSA